MARTLVLEFPILSALVCMCVRSYSHIYFKITIIKSVAFFLFHCDDINTALSSFLNFFCLCSTCCARCTKQKSIVKKLMELIFIICYILWLLERQQWCGVDMRQALLDTDGTLIRFCICSERTVCVCVCPRVRAPLLQALNDGASFKMINLKGT